MKNFSLNILVLLGVFQIQAFEDRSVTCENRQDSLRYYKEILYKTKKIAVSYTSQGTLVIKDLVLQTIIKRDTLGDVPLRSIKIEDYNHDSVMDIRYGYNSNYFYENIFLYDFASKTWRELKNVKGPNYAYSKQIPNANVYYSYSADGCGKNNWLSYLFVINRFSVQPIGLLQYRQCADDEKGIYLYKVSKKGQKFKKKLPLKPVGNEDNFYERYWTKHFREYIQ
jgi:hypothetical protein